MDYNRKVLSMVLAGGEGRRLYPLTKDRAKPAVPIGGRYRIIDFVLSNFINSGLYKIKVLTQFKSSSLNDHLSRAYSLSRTLDHFIDAVPAQMRSGPFWYRGTADAVYQNLNLIFDEEPEIVCVFGGDHVYKMDIRQMIDFHIEKNADVTVCAVSCPIGEASEQFGVIEVDNESRMIGFQEKPKNPREIPGRPGKTLASMGNYIFKTEKMLEILEKDALRDTSHDFGKTIIPGSFESYKVCVYDFYNNSHPGMTEPERAYWKDVGTIHSYWKVNMDLAYVSPTFNIYNERWPIRSYHPDVPPAKFVFADKKHERMGIATDSLVAEGTIISGGTIDKSILFPKVRINSYSQVSESILMEGVDVGRYSKIRKTIIDKGVKIPPNTTIGYDHEKDKSRFHISPEGIVVIPKGALIKE